LSRLLGRLLGRVDIFDGGGFRDELGVLLVVFAWPAGFLVGVRAREADETCCREVLPLVVVCLKVEGELERVDTGLAWLEASCTLRASLGSREVGEAGDVGDIGGSTSCLVAT
jgi:hypothetical protein